MESLGQYLKRERELKNISLAEIAKKTRVREPLLRAIEEDKYNVLPSSAYVRSFLSAYAKSVGLDPNDVIARYEKVLDGGPVTSPTVLVPKRRFWRWKLPSVFGKKIGILGGIIGGAIVIVLAAFYFLSLPAPERPIVPNPPITAKPEAKGVLPSPSPLPESDKAFVHGEKPFSLQLKAAEKTWVRMQINGQPEQEMTFNSGEGASYQGMRRIHLIVGNAGGLDLIFNGKRLERFGRSGEVVALTVTEQGVTVQPRGTPKPP